MCGVVVVVVVYMNIEGLCENKVSDSQFSIGCWVLALNHQPSVVEAQPEIGATRNEGA